MKDIKGYIGKKFAVQCSSKEEWQKIMDLAPDKLFTTTNHFNNSLVKVISLNDFGTYWSYSTKEEIESTGYTILPASDFLGKTKKEMFYEGDYIVTLINDGDCGKVNYCSKQREDSSSLKPVIDTKGYHHNSNWEFLASDTSNTKWRYATPEEIAEYERIGKPYDVTTLHKQPNFVVGKWYKFNWDWHSKTNGETIIKVKGVEKDRVTTEGRIYMYRDRDVNFIGVDCYNFSEISNIRELTDLSEIQQYLPEGHPDKIVKPKSLVGRYLKALVDNPNSGANVNKDDYGVIVNSNFVNFPNNKGYSCSAAILYFTENPNKQFFEDKYELMPEGFKPPEKLPKYVKCIQGYGCAKLGYIYDTSNNEESQKLFHLTWEEVLIDFEHLGNKFEISTKEEFEKQNDSTSMTPKGEFNEGLLPYKKEEKPHIVNVQTTCVNLRTKTKNKYLTL